MKTKKTAKTTNITMKARAAVGKVRLQKIRPTLTASMRLAAEDGYADIEESIYSIAFPIPISSRLAELLDVASCIYSAYKKSADDVGFDLWDYVDDDRLSDAVKWAAEMLAYSDEDFVLLGGAFLEYVTTAVEPWTK